MKKHSTNRNFKNGVFQLLFNDKERLLELFNALEGTDYTDPEAVTIQTLSAALYNNLINDLAFSVAEQYIVLTEHQATANENMPLRMFLYAAREFEQILKLDELLKEKLYRIPTPHFYVLYNGTREQPATWEMKLSDAFMDGTGRPALELVVKVININESSNHPVLSKSPTLRGYSRLVSLVRENLNRGLSRDEAIAAAIKECIKEGVLADFLKKHGAEVANDMFKEYTMEDMLRIRSEEAMERGMERGIAKGIEQGLEQGLEQGIERGMEQGLEKGLEKGLELGIRNFILDFREEGFSRERIVEKLQRRFELSERSAREYYDRFVEE